MSSETTLLPHTSGYRTEYLCFILKQIRLDCNYNPKLSTSECLDTRLGTRSHTPPVTRADAVARV